MELLRHTSCVLSVHRSSSKEEALFDETVGHIQDILLGGWVGGGKGSFHTQLCFAAIRVDVSKGLLCREVTCF